MVDVFTFNAPRRAVSRRSRILATAIVAALAASLLVATPATAASRPGSADPASLNPDRMRKGHNATPTRPVELDRGPQFAARTPVWPSATTSDVVLVDSGLRADGSDVALWGRGVGAAADARRPVRADHTP